MQEAVDAAVDMDRNYTPRELYSIAENTIEEAERSGRKKLSEKEKATIKAQYIRGGRERVYVKEETPFILFNISRIKNDDITGLDRCMVLDQVCFCHSREGSFSVVVVQILTFLSLFTLTGDQHDRFA